MKLGLVKKSIAEITIGMIIIRANVPNIEFDEYGIPLSNLNKLDDFIDKGATHLFVWEKPEPIFADTSIDTSIDMSDFIESNSIISNEKLKEAMLILNISKTNFIQSLTSLKRAKKIERDLLITTITNLITLSTEIPYILTNIYQLNNIGSEEDIHAINVTMIAITIAQELNLSEKEIIDLGIASIFHDIGKYRIPENILNQKNKLTDGEFSIIRKHPEWGNQLLSKYSTMPDNILQAIADHHEHIDGTGYPNHYTAPHISQTALILGIAEDYDTMIGGGIESYPVLHNTEAIKKIHVGAGKKNLKSNIKAFIKVIGIFPVGALVQLTDKSIAIVVELNIKDPINSKVISFGVKAKHQPKYINLSETDNLNISVPIRRTHYSTNPIDIVEQYVAARINL